MMKRPMAMFERAMYLEGSLHVNVTVTARLWGRISEQRLRQALDRVQAKHGILRCLLVRENGRPYFVEQATPPPIPLRIVERKSDEDWFDESTSDSLQRFDGSLYPLARLVWLRSELENELLLVCSHAVCDGKSLMLLLQELLLLCDQPDASIGTPTTLNGMEEVFPAKVLADRKLRRYIRWRVALLKFMMRFSRSSKKRWTYGAIYRNLWRLDEQASQVFVARCKAEGVTVFAALSVAILQAFHKVCGPKYMEKFEAPVDFRRYLPNLREDSLFAVAPTIQLSLDKLPGVDPEGTGFWALARAMKTDITKKIDGLETSIYPLFLGMEQLHDVYDKMFAQAQSQRAGRQVSLSYVGRLDMTQSFNDFRVQEICDITAMMSPTPANLVVIYSYGGRFYFSISSDESSLSRVQAEQIQQQVTETLLQCAAPVEKPFAVANSIPSAAHAEVS
ncbi:condensation domain-containing protein [Granulicella mallensis]|uniref:Condensation domain protein n=1 Tax=Granulicella mallensis (strain ATCC BAA-1857 / DSM 23137 / MP5ACTX8) TaxID=682795 RepID=G8NQ02_GRAMM|nr:condensation domain-containing protein [Granulicella mallensis]AEU38336.1 condensation domain protein [Granulicella mallensis MP5ACTX8]